MTRKFWLISLGIVAIIIIITLVLLAKYHKNPEENSRKYKINKSELAKIQRQIHVVIHRYEQALFSLNRDSLAAGIERLSHIYPPPLIEKDIWKNPQTITQLRAYLDDKIIGDIYKEVARQYPDVTFLQEELDAAFGFLLHYFPDASIPNIYTIVPGLDVNMPSVFGFDNNIFIQLDQYLGTDFKMYAQAGIPKYIVARCDRKYMATDCFSKTLVYNWLPTLTRVSLLENMIHEGKKIYFTELMFPNTAPETIFGYSAEQYAWANANQGNVWHYIIEKNLLFNKDEATSRNFCEDAPFTKPFARESTGRMGVFIGWKIVRQYMENQPEISLSELMQTVNYQEILDKSRYKPTMVR